MLAQQQWTSRATGEPPAPSMLATVASPVTVRVSSLAQPLPPSVTFEAPPTEVEPPQLLIVSTSTLPLMTVV